jgi:hypothetical protein
VSISAAFREGNEKIARLNLSRIDHHPPESQPTITAEREMRAVTKGRDHIVSRQHEIAPASPK